MKTPTKIAIGAVLGILALLILQRVLTRPSDQVLIKRALDEAISGSREGRTGPVMDFVSKSLEVNSDSYGISRNQISNFIKKSQPDVKIDNPNPVINGSEATIQSPVRVKMKLAMFETPEFNVNAKITLAKESSLEWLILPVAKWRITKIEAEDLPGTISGP